MDRIERPSTHVNQQKAARTVPAAIWVSFASVEGRQLSYYVFSFLCSPLSILEIRCSLPLLVYYGSRSSWVHWTRVSVGPGSLNNPYILVFSWIFKPGDVVVSIFFSAISSHGLRFLCTSASTACNFSRRLILTSNEHQNFNDSCIVPCYRAHRKSRSFSMKGKILNSERRPWSVHKSLDLSL